MIYWQSTQSHSVALHHNCNKRTQLFLVISTKSLSSLLQNCSSRSHNTYSRNRNNFLVYLTNLTKLTVFRITGVKLTFSRFSSKSNSLACPRNCGNRPHQAYYRNISYLILIIGTISMGGLSCILQEYNSQFPWEVNMITQTSVIHFAGEKLTSSQHSK